jgi:hypothetical protein
LVAGQQDPTGWSLGGNSLERLSSTNYECRLASIDANGMVDNIYRINHYIKRIETWSNCGLAAIIAMATTTIYQFTCITTWPMHPINEPSMDVIEAKLSQPMTILKLKEGGGDFGRGEGWDGVGGVGGMFLRLFWKIYSIPQGITFHFCWEKVIHMRIAISKKMVCNLLNNHL